MKSAIGAKTRNAKRMQSSGLIAVLLAGLLWQTKWPSLRLGLAILLLSYLGSTLLLLYRNRELSASGAAEPAAWFDREQAWTTGMMLFENISRTVGFMALGYGIWVPTGSVTVALLLGVVYPAATYFGLERRSYERRIRVLQTERSEAVDAVG